MPGERVYISWVRAGIIMKIYHITGAPEVKQIFLHFWGCNFMCRGCVRRKELYDSHLRETRDTLFEERKKPLKKPACLLDLGEVKDIIKEKDFSQVIFMGMEPTLDPELPKLAEFLHNEFHSYNILLTNGLRLIPLENVDEVVVSIKAYQDDIHRDYTGISNRKVLENFARLYHSGAKLRSESVFIPEYIDYFEIENIAKFIAGVDKGIPYRIDAYIPFGDNPWRRPTSQEMKKAVGIAQKYLLNVSCLTGDETVKAEVIRIC